MKLKNISYRKYEPKDFEKVFKIFIEFQAKAKVSHYDTLGKDQSALFVLPYLAGELQKLIKDHKYHYVGINKETDEIIAYACFGDSVIIDGGIDLILVFKDEKIPFNRLFKYLMLLTMKKEFPDKRIFAALGKRDRFDEYVAFMKKSFKIHVMHTDSFGKIYIEFLLHEYM